MTTILVTGASGQLGMELQNLEPDFKQYTFFFTDKENLSITNFENVKNFVLTHKINIIINCAAYTQVDKAEDEPEIANSINYLAVKNLAQIAKTQKCMLIHISTDYVFDGSQDKPYIETDVVNPQNVYGKTKMLGEQAILTINPENAIIIRTSWLYSVYGNNFVKTMLRLGSERNELKVVSDQIGSPTYAADLAMAILNIIPKIKSEKTEIYHYSNGGKCSWYKFAQSIFKNSRIICNVLPVDSSEFHAKAKRPRYSLLNNKKIQSTFGIVISDWEDSLKKCLKKTEVKR